MITYVQRNITTVGYGIVAHGTNCSMGFGSGVAGDIRAKWPIVYEEFMKTPGKDMLGKACLINLDPMCDTLMVANVYTQQNYGYDGAKYASTDAIRSGMTQVMEWAQKYGLPVYIPKIGAKRGGLDWDRDVKPIINELCERYNVRLYVCIWPPEDPSKGKITFLES